MGEFAIDVELRDGTGKGQARRLRSKGRIPAVCYGHKKAAVALSVGARDLDRLLRSSSAGINTLIDLRVAGGAEPHGATVLVKELQRDPVDGAFVHADFFAVDLTEKITVSIPLNIIGIAFGTTMGGILDQALRQLEVQCLPNAIPEQIEVDVTALDVGDSIHVRDLAASRRRRVVDRCGSSGRFGGGSGGRRRGTGRRSCRGRRGGTGRRRIGTGTRCGGGKRRLRSRQRVEPVKLVVGLGNPGQRYTHTRHNVGVRVLERFARDQRIALSGERFGGRFGCGSLMACPDADRGEFRAGLEVGLLAPQTYMNLSGESVAQALQGLSVEDPARDLLVLFDDVDLPLGRLRVRPRGGSGGHRGLASVIECLGRSDFPRLRFGIGRPATGPGDTVDWVLQNFADAEEAELARAVPLAAEAVATVIVRGVTVAMNRYNRDPAAQA